MTREERNKESIRALLAAADEGDLERVLSSFSPDFLDHDANEARDGGSSDLEGAARAFAMFAEAFPDTRHTLHDLIAEGDRVVARISAEGTHTGTIRGMPPTGRRIRNDSITIYRLDEEGRIVERWCRDRHAVFDQLRQNEGRCR